MRKKGFHAGEYAYFVARLEPKGPYELRYRQIQSAKRDGDKVSYSFSLDGRILELPASRVFDDAERAAGCAKRLNLRISQKMR